MPWRTRIVILSTACLIAYSTPALAQKPGGPRLGDISFTGLGIRNNRDISSAKLGREFTIWVSFASTAPITELFVEAVALDGGKTAPVSWDGGPLAPPVMCCILEIPFKLPLDLKYRRIEFHIWVKDAKKRVSNKLTHVIFIYD